MIRTRSIALAALLTAFTGAPLAAASLPAFLTAVPQRAAVTVIARIKGRADLTQLAGNASRVEAILREHAARTQRETVSFLAKRGIRDYTSLWAANVVIVTAPRAVIEEMAELPSVESIGENKIIPLVKSTARDVEIAAGEIAWGVKKVKADQVWTNFGIDGTGVLVGHIDTGVDGNHPDLKGKVVAFKDFVKRDNTAIIDGQGHGTHTAGTILGGSADGQRIGVAPGAKMVTARVFTARGATTAVLLESMQWIMNPDGNPATPDVPRLVSNSWGSNDGTDRSFYDIVESWRAANIYPCFAAGNAGPNRATVGIPGAYLNTLAVGALDSADKIAYFSSRGPVKWDGKEYLKPEVSAPGHQVHSAKDGGGYQSMSGTSMACPHVAGVITLLYAAKADLKIDEITALLQDTSTDLGDPGHDNSYGRGAVNALTAVGMTRASRLSGRVTDVDGKPLAATIDYAGANGSGRITAAADGTFSLALPKGEYKLTFSMTGFQSVERNVTVGDGNAEVLAALTALPRGTLEGRILSAAGQPVKATVTVLNAQVPAQAANPSDGSYRLVLPAGKYELKVTARGFKVNRFEVTLAASATTSRNVTMDAALPYLLVDDDGGATLERYYTPLLSEGLFTHHDVRRDGAIDDVDELAPYLVVIWFTGERAGALTSAQQSVLTEYLKAGGRLLLAGQNIARGLQGSAFLKDVLQVALGDESMPLRYPVRGIVGDPISGGITEFGLNGPVVQTSPDSLTVAGPKASACLQYATILGKRTAAVKVDGGAYRIVYTGFGLEGVAGDAIRGALGQAALNWLKPQASSLAARHDNLPATERGAFAAQAVRILGVGSDDKDLGALKTFGGVSRDARRTINFR